jgi:purine-binding chemotaxis protein CheW
MSEELARKTIHPVPHKSELARASDTMREFLAFDLGQETYALPLGSIREILKPPAITGVPRAQHDVIGIISVRGRITTVIDLRRRMNLEESAHTKATRILLIDRADEIVGVLVDRVHQVYRLGAEEIEFSSVVGSDAGDHFMGIGRPRATRGARGAGLLESEHAILILLDPIPLLRR